jgi:hypothetical protein
MKLTSSFSWIPSAALVLSCSSPAASIATDAASSSDVGSSDAARRDSASGKSDAGAESRDAGHDAPRSRDAPAADGSGARADAEAGTPQGDETGVTAVLADTFLSSLGVCTHVGQGVDAPTPSATALSFAGIRNIRDDGTPAHIADWTAMHASSGVRMSLLTNQDIASTVTMATELNAAGALLDVEGPNEPNNEPVTYEGATSSSTTFVPVADFQRDLYAAVKSTAALRGIPVFHSSEAGGSEPDDVGLQFLTIPTGAGIAMPDGTEYADYANIHNYVCGHSQVLSDNVAWNASDPTLNGDWDGLYVEYGKTWNKGYAGYANADLLTLPRVTTETGWLTMGTGAITEEQQARVFLNLYLSAFTRGFSYTFIYMLRDDPVQGYWGLFDTSYDPKTSGTYIHNLTTILADTAGGAPLKLDYVIMNEPTTVHDLLLQKKDGTFHLAVWDDRPTGGSDTVIVDLTKVRPKVSLYDPTMGTLPIGTMQNVSEVMLTLTDHPVILEL